MTSSVVIATYNGEKYIKDQLESILSQSRKPDYIVVTDDGSKDSTITICDKLLSQSNIKYKIIGNKMKSGVANNFFSGINVCEEDVIFFCDQDDIWMKKKIEKVMNIFENNLSCRMVLHDAYIWFPEQEENKETIFHKFNIFELFDISGKYDRDKYCSELICRNFATGMCMAIHKSLASRSQENLHIFHDTWFNLNSVAFGDIYACLEPLSLYRQHKNNVQGMNNSNLFTKIRRFIQNNYKSIKKEEEKYEIIDSLQKEFLFLNDNNLMLFQERYKYLKKRKYFIESGNIVGLLRFIRKNKEMDYYSSRLFIIRDIITCFWNRRKIC